MTFKEETPMALGQALKGTSQAPEAPPATQLLETPLASQWLGEPGLWSAVKTMRGGFPAACKQEADGEERELLIQV